MSEKQIDCVTCQEQVNEFLQQELTEAELKLITHHIANCDECDAHYNIENTINEMIREKCEVEAPEEVISKIREQLDQLR